MARRRPVLYILAIFIAQIVARPALSQAAQWSNLATVSNSTSLQAGSLCATDGRDIYCNSSVATLSGLAQADRITSGTAGVFVSNTGVINFRTGGVTTGYFDTSGLLVAPGVSTTGVISSAEVYTRDKIRMFADLLIGNGGTKISSTGISSGDHILIGKDASITLPSAGSGFVVIGTGASAVNSSYVNSGNVAIGYNANVNSGGNGAINTAVGGYAVALGPSAAAFGGRASANNGGTAIGAGAQSSGGTAMGVGAQAVGGRTTAIGQSAAAYAQDGVYGGTAVGTGSIATSWQFVAGCDSVYCQINSVYFGKGVSSSTPIPYSINGTAGWGTDVAGGGLILAGGKGTGAALGGPVIFQTSQPGASSGFQRGLLERMRVDANGRVGIATQTPTVPLEVSGTVSATDIRLSSLATPPAAKCASAVDEGRMVMTANGPYVCQLR